MRCSAVTPNMSAAFPVLRDFSASFISASVIGGTILLSFLHRSIISNSSFVI